jgi:CheY-like chemotaxis protein|tara:strand:+ start:441 stop:545 length:105 start_codon:yes stop_codon:yes gene_type:complete
MFLVDDIACVLIVEDGENNRELLSVILSEEGYHI